LRSHQLRDRGRVGHAVGPEELHLFDEAHGERLAALEELIDGARPRAHGDRPGNRCNLPHGFDEEPAVEELGAAIAGDDSTEPAITAEAAKARRGRQLVRLAEQVGDEPAEPCVRRLGPVEVVLARGPLTVRPSTLEDLLRHLALQAADAGFCVGARVGRGQARDRGWRCGRQVGLLRDGGSRAHHDGKPGDDPPTPNLHRTS
jgi:hypothetical protein